MKRNLPFENYAPDLFGGDYCWSVPIHGYVAPSFFDGG
jgi:hypothetical protein